MQLGYRHIELVALGVLDREEFPVRATDIELEQALIPADTMIDVNDRRADRQFGQITDHRFGIACRAFAATTLLGTFAEQFALGQHADRGLDQGKPCSSAATVIANRAGVAGSDKLFPRADRGHRHASGAYLFGQRFAAAG